MSDADVLIVGGGLAGLACARVVAAAGRRPLVLESSDAAGGRVRTDVVDGFRLDRGFQVLLTGYAEAGRVLDYDALDLQPFAAGALVRTGDRFVRLSDPYRNPTRALGALLAPLGSVRDKLRVGRMRRALLRISEAEIWQRPETTTRERLREYGIGDEFVERFFRPWFGGVFFDRSLATSSRMFEFVFRTFAQGRAALPAQGMGAIPAQLAAALPEGCLRLNAGVDALTDDGLRLASGETLRAPAVVVAADANTAHRLLSFENASRWRAATCVRFAADRAPFDDPLLALNGDEDGPVNDFHVASNVAPDYAPAGAALCSATVLDDRGLDDDAIDTAVRDQLSRWFGRAVGEWRRLAVQRIPHALPDQTPPALAHPHRSVRHGPGRYVCGDHRENASIDGALRSGRRAAETLLADREGGAS